jgi:hypothetical protein
MLTLPLRQSLLGFPFGLRLPGPFNPTIGTGSHLARLSETYLSDLLIPFTAFGLLTYALFYCFGGWGVKGRGDYQQSEV